MPTSFRDAVLLVMANQCSHKLKRWAYHQGISLAMRSMTTQLPSLLHVKNSSSVLRSAGSLCETPFGSKLHRLTCGFMRSRATTSTTGTGSGTTQSSVHAPIRSLSSTIRQEGQEPSITCIEDFPFVHCGGSRQNLHRPQTTCLVPYRHNLAYRVRGAFRPKEESVVCCHVRLATCRSRAGTTCLNRSQQQAICWQVLGP